MFTKIKHTITNIKSSLKKPTVCITNQTALQERLVFRLPTMPTKTKHIIAPPTAATPKTTPHK